MQIPIEPVIERVPGGMMVVPLALAEVPIRRRRLALQLQSTFNIGVLGAGLMGSSPN
jgi:hypothetical protein